MAAPMDVNTTPSAFVVVGNIPSNFHSADLRNYFSQFVESKGFECFHFKHRPEARARETDEITATPSASGSDVLTSSPYTQNRKDRRPKITRKTLCCVVKLNSAKAGQFMKMYHGKLWVERDGSAMACRCRITKIKLRNDVDGSGNTTYKTRKETQLIPDDRETFTANDLLGLPELSPPSVMPNGNVGTPTSFFMKLIRSCQMPPSIIKKLGLVFPKSRSTRRYGNVPFSYGGEVHIGGEIESVYGVDSEEMRDPECEGTSTEHSGDSPHEGNIVNSSKSRDYENVNKQSRLMKKKKSKDVNRHKDLEPEKDDDDDDNDDDDDTFEDWERHEALHDDVTEQGRIKERLYEEEIELKWEKGGSGLVFYTDANYWDEQEGDFDERTADDWDVDMSIYYDPDGGDKDARDLMQMRLEEQRRAGAEDCVHPNRIGHFESHTKGIGRKVLEKQGWTDGEGLGSSVIGLAEALTNEGQNPRQRMGFGYYGEKLNRNVKRKRLERGIISTIYDEPDEMAPTEPVFRSQHPWTLKYRPNIQFMKARDTDDN